METVRQNVLLERTGIFGRTTDKKFEYTMERKKTNFLMNNLFQWGTVRLHCVTCLRRLQTIESILSILSL
ncbi:hypothetical protein IMSAGC003_01082 [Lachnospiraceae bacterium]|nr:hypothetical protein IMSAGC003_01082 [Lachnospiraceae bacterium]